MADPRMLAQALMSGRTVDPYMQEYPRQQERQGRLAQALMGLRQVPRDMVEGAPVVGDIAETVAQWARNNPLDAGALAISPVPVVGDIAGLANDMRHYAAAPESRTWGNYALSAAGLLPLVPGVAGTLAKAADDLPMDEASRMARAREMGFDVETPVYHGTGADISAFEARRPGKNMQMPIAGTQFATDAEFASLYAVGKSPNVVPAYVRPGKTLDTTALVVEGSEEAEFLKELLKGTGQKPYWGDPGNGGPKVAPPLASYIDAYPKKAERLLDKYKYDSLRHEAKSGTIRPGGGMMVSASSPTVIVRDPRNIRSRFARFDPRNVDSADLLAGIAGAGVVGNALLADRDRRDNPGGT